MPDRGAGPAYGGSLAGGGVPAGAWRATPAFSRALAVTGAFLLLAVALRRVDALIIALPLLVGTLIGLVSRPRRTPVITLRATSDSLLEGQATTAVVRVDGNLGVGETIDVASVQLDTATWTSGVGGAPARAVAITGEAPREVGLDVRTMRWGRHPLGPARLVATAGFGLVATREIHSNVVSITTLPLPDDFDVTDTVPKAAGLVGPHRSRRRGDGTDLSGVREFAAGDRLHRINWPVSLRTGTLHVNSTLSDRDAEVVLVLDTQFDVGESGGVQGSASSLDTTVRAAAAVAEHYLRHGDRVGLLDLGRAATRVPSGAGTRHLMRILDVLLDAKPQQQAGRGLQAGVALASLRPGALVLLLSPLIGEQPLDRAAALARSGYSVLIIDTLPQGAHPERRSDWTMPAWRLWMVERAADIGRLAELGVPAVAWSGAGSLDQVLRDVSRAAAAPKSIR